MSFSQAHQREKFPLTEVAVQQPPHIGLTWKHSSSSSNQAKVLPPEPTAIIPDMSSAFPGSL